MIGTSVQSAVKAFANQMSILIACLMSHMIAMLGKMVGNILGHSSLGNMVGHTFIGNMVVAPSSLT